MRLLLVEDDMLLGRALKAALVQAGYTTDWVTDGETSLEALRTSDYGAVALDINLPGASGLEILKTLRHSDKTPVIIMTARDGLDDRIKGLDLGADDYIVKPFAVEELLARLRAVTRRNQGRAEAVIRYQDLEIDTVSKTVMKAGAWVKLTARELSVLLLLFDRLGRLVAKSTIEDHVYGWDGDVDSNTVEAAIYAIRKKLGRELITTVRGVGYVINP
jgi:DNA-binding response OmpR family regulator